MAPGLRRPHSASPPLEAGAGHIGEAMEGLLHWDPALSLRRAQGPQVEPKSGPHLHTLPPALPWAKMGVRDSHCCKGNKKQTDKSIHVD